MYFCIICFYDEEMKGRFTVDYIFTDMKKANIALKEYIDAIESDTEPRRCWPVLYVANITILLEDTYYVYLDQVKKRLYISLEELSKSPFIYRKLILPIVTDEMPEEYTF